MKRRPIERGQFSANIDEKKVVKMVRTDTGEKERETEEEEGCEDVQFVLLLLHLSLCSLRDRAEPSFRLCFRPCVPAAPVAPVGAAAA